MNQYYRFDLEGYYIDPIIADYDEKNPRPDNTTEIRPPDGMYRARFTGSEWVEAGEPPEPAEPTTTTEQYLGQLITDMEISDIIQGQQITDLELKILSAEANINV